MAIIFDNSIGPVQSPEAIALPLPTPTPSGPVFVNPLAFLFPPPSVLAGDVQGVGFLGFPVNDATASGASGVPSAEEVNAQSGFFLPAFPVPSAAQLEQDRIGAAADVARGGEQIAAIQAQGSPGFLGSVALSIGRLLGVEVAGDTTITGDNGRAIMPQGAFGQTVAGLRDTPAPVIASTFGGAFVESQREVFAGLDRGARTLTGGIIPGGLSLRAIVVGGVVLVGVLVFGPALLGKTVKGAIA